MRPLLARFSEPVSSVHAPSWAYFITATPAFKLSVHTVGVISSRGWKRQFEEPIPLPRGRQLVTLEDAGEFITRLPKAECETVEW
jgi:hypothetical protein